MWSFSLFIYSYLAIPDLSNIPVLSSFQFINFFSKSEIKYKFLNAKINIKLANIVFIKFGRSVEKIITFLTSC